jgi:hypothetical protein
MQGASMNVAQLSELVAALRAAGITHYDGPVPGWPEGRNVKLIVGAQPLEPAAATAEPKPRRRLTHEEREQALDDALTRHFKIHGGPDAAARPKGGA